MNDIISYVWLVDLDGTMNDDTDRMKKYGGDHEDYSSWTQYHGNWQCDPPVRSMWHLVNRIPETDWLFFVSLRQIQHWTDTREELEWRLRRQNFGLFLYNGKKSKHDAWWEDIGQIASIVQRRLRTNSNMFYGGSFLVDDSDWRCPVLRSHELFGDFVHMQVTLPPLEDD